MSKIVDLAVIGGGVIGCAIAREASLGGMSVLLFERGRPGGESSGAAAGMLMPHVESGHAGALQELGIRSRALYDGFVGRVRDESGIDPGLSRQGSLHLARTVEEIESLDTRCRNHHAAGLRVERIERSQLKELEPGLGEPAGGALFFPDDASVDCTLLMRGLHLAAVRAGTAVLTGTGVTRLLLDGARVVGVDAGGERVSAGQVVVAAGAWSGALMAGDLPAPSTFPVRGQILCLEPEGDPIHHIICAGSSYVVRRADGRVLAGSTMERVGFDTRVTVDGLTGVGRTAMSIVPALRSATLVTSWAGLRPATTDGLPAIGPGAVPGLHYACGHLRHGILLAPVTARMVFGMLTGTGVEGLDPAPFDPRRVPGGPVDAP